MDALSFFDSGVFTWVVLPLLIFFARICDVTIGTIRIIFIGRGNKAIAPILGFFEVLIWLLAIRQIMQNLTNGLYYVAYAAGYATGTFVGMYLEEKMAMGSMMLRIITPDGADELLEHLKAESYGVTVAEAQGARGPVKIIFMIVKRSDLPAVTGLVERYDPDAFYTIEDVRSVERGVFPAGESMSRGYYLNLFRFSRRRK